MKHNIITFIAAALLFMPCSGFAANPVVAGSNPEDSVGTDSAIHKNPSEMVSAVDYGAVNTDAVSKEVSVDYALICSIFALACLIALSVVVIIYKNRMVQDIAHLQKSLSKASKGADELIVSQMISERIAKLKAELPQIVAEQIATISPVTPSPSIEDKGVAPGAEIEVKIETEVPVHQAVTYYGDYNSAYNGFPKDCLSDAPGKPFVIITTSDASAVYKIDETVSANMLSGALDGLEYHGDPHLFSTIKNISDGELVFNSDMDAFTVIKKPVIEFK